MKGQKLNFSEFVSSTGGANREDELPSGSSGLPMEDRPRGGRWDKQRADAEGGYGNRSGGRGSRFAGGDEEGGDFGGGGEEEGPSRADESAAWRRAPAAGGGGDGREGRYGGGGGGGGRGGDGGGYRDRGDRDGGSRGGGSFGDRSGERRSGFGGGRGGDGAEGGDGGERDMGAFRRRADDSGDRDRQSQQGGDDRGVGGRSDSVDEWRSSRAATAGGGRGRDDDSYQPRGGGGGGDRGDADAEWRKFPLRDRGGDDREGGRGGYGYGGRGGDRGDRRSDDQGSGNNERRSGFAGGRFGREEGGEDGGRDDRERGRGGFDRDREGGSRGSDRFGGGRGDSERYEGGGGGGRGGFDRSDSGRAGGDRYDGAGRSSVGRRGDVGRDEQQQQTGERPAHLRNLLKKSDEDNNEVGEEVEGKKESALERMEREAAEREKAATQSAASASMRPSRPVSGAAEGDSADEPKRQYGLGRLAERAALATSTVTSTASEERETANKPAELAPLKMSALRKTPAAANSAAGGATGAFLPTQSATRGKRDTEAAADSPAAPAPVMDDSRYADELKKPLTTAKKTNALEKAIADRETLTPAQLTEAMQKLDLQQAGASKRKDVAGVIMRSITSGSMKLDAAVSTLAGKDDGETLAEALKLYKDRKGESELTQLVQTASGVDIIAALMPNTPKPSAADVDAFLTRHSLLVLRPVPDLTADLPSLLSSSPSPQAVLDHINAAVPQSTPVPAPVAKLIYAHLFDQLFAANPPSTTLLTSYAPLLRRLSSSSPIALLYAAQLSWFNKGAAKGALKDVFAALLSGTVVSGADVVGWRDDLKEGKGINGKPKALLQVSAFCKTVEEEEKKRRPKEEEEEEEEDEDEDEDEEDDAY